MWLASDGSGRNLSVSGDPRFPTVRDRAGWVKAGRPPLDVGRSDDKFAPGTGVPAWERILTKLPTDPRKLAGLISGRKLEGGPPGPQEDFAQIGDLLRYVYTPPKLRAALFEVAAHTPGVEVLGRVKDQAGRVGIGVAQVSGPGGGERTLSELIFDPATAGLLGEQTVAVNSRTHARTLTDWTVYLRAGVAGSMYSVPAHLTVP